MVRKTYGGGQRRFRDVLGRRAAFLPLIAFSAQEN